MSNWVNRFFKKYDVGQAAWYSTVICFLGSLSAKHTSIEYFTGNFPFFFLFLTCFFAIIPQKGIINRKTFLMLLFIWKIKSCIEEDLDGHRELSGDEAYFYSILIVIIIFLLPSVIKIMEATAEKQKALSIKP